MIWAMTEPFFSLPCVLGTPFTLVPAPGVLRFTYRTTKCTSLRLPCRKSLGEGTLGRKHPAGLWLAGNTLGNNLTKYERAPSPLSGPLSSVEILAYVSDANGIAWQHEEPIRKQDYSLQSVTDKDTPRKLSAMHHARRLREDLDAARRALRVDRAFRIFPL